MTRAVRMAILLSVATFVVACGRSPDLRALDTDGDGIVSQAEIEQALRSLEADRHANLVAGALKQCDTGEPGLRTEAELECLARVRLARPSPQTIGEAVGGPRVGLRSMASVALAILAVFLSGILVARLVSRSAAWTLSRWTRGAWFRMPGLLQIALALAACLAAALGLAWVFSRLGVLPDLRVSVFGTPVTAPRMLVAAGALTGVGVGLSQWGRARRIRGLEGIGVHAPPAVPAGPGKAIVICCDGTGNRADAREQGHHVSSNVWRFYQTLASPSASGWDQFGWYDDGVGTNTSRTGRLLAFIGRSLKSTGFSMPAQVAGVFERVFMIAELAFGVGITENITQAYREVVRQYRPGDRIYLMGFSRGAYTARCVAGVIYRAGLLKSENVRYAADVVQQYRFRLHQHDPIQIRPDLVHPGVRVHFLGVWDTVASLGVPLWGWTFKIGCLWSNQAMDTSPVPICRTVRHALSIDEERSQFLPTLFDETSPDVQAVDLEQVWFRGSHSGVGGGYTDSELSDIALGWMMAEAHATGLRFTGTVDGHPLGAVYTQVDRQKFWQLAGSWPRWHPCDVPGRSRGFGILHQTAIDRAIHARGKRAPEGPIASDELLRVGTAPGAAPQALVRVRADRPWNRTGVVLGAGVYRLTYVGGQWRDQEKPPCGPAGQRAGVLDVRRGFGWGRRLRDAAWMELVLHVAHPRDWPFRELPGRRLLYYLLLRDPDELTSTLVPAGRHLTSIGASVDIEISSEPGMLYAFANDWWLAYGNNTGSVDLEVRAIPAADVRPPSYAVWPSGLARPRDPAAAVTA